MTPREGTWVNFDGSLSYVVGLYPNYYEQYDAEVVNGENKTGERRERQIVLRDLYSDTGRRMKGTPHAYYLDAIKPDLHPLTEQEQAKIDRFCQNQPEAWQRWIDDATICMDYVYVGFGVSREQLDNTAKVLRRLARQLPETFSFTNLVTLAASSGIDLTGCTTDYHNRFETMVSFKLVFQVGERLGRQQLFRTVTDIDTGDREEDRRLLSGELPLFNYECLFLFIARNTKEYLTLNPETKLQAFFDILKPAFMSLINNKRDNELANLYRRWVPKRMFSREEAWTLAADWLDNISSLHGTAPIASTLRTAEWHQQYNWIYDVCS